MSKIFFVLLGTLVGRVTYGQSFVLEGRTPAKLNGLAVELSVSEIYDQEKHETKYKATVERDSFRIEGTLNNPAAIATITSKNGYYLCAIDTGLNVLNVQELPAKPPFFKNLLSNAVIEKSISNSICREIADMQNNFYVKYGRPTPGNEKVIGLDSFRKAEMAKQELTILKKNKTAYYSLVHLYNIYFNRSRSLEELTDVFDAFSDTLKATPLAIEFEAMINLSRKMLVGQKIPPIILIDTSGVEISADYLIGKNYLLAFGATWCKPCKKNYPLLRELYTKYKNANFEIISVNLDENKSEWLKQIREYRLNWLHVSELKPWRENQNSKTFEVFYLPLYILVDRNGVMAYNSIQSKDYKTEKLEQSIIQATID